MMNLHPSLKVRFNKDFKKVNNSEFVIGTALIAHAGDNRNGSDITEEAFNEAMSSLGLIPIVGNWISEKNNFGGHDITLEWEGNNLVLKDKTVPFGCVKENHNAEWVEVEENGEKHRYLKADVVLWYGRYSEQIQKVIDDGVNQSMEINVNDYEEKYNSNIQINKFEYSALCLLGKEVDEYGNKGEDNVEPCFPSSSVVVDQHTLNSDEFKEKFNKFLFAYKTHTEETNEIRGKEENIVEEKLDTTVEFSEVDENNENLQTEESMDVSDVEANEETETVYNCEETIETEEIDTIFVNTDDVIAEENSLESKIKEYELNIAQLESENEELKTKLSSYEETIKENENIVSELTKYKEDNELSLKQAEVDLVIEEFETVLKDVEEFENIKLEAINFEIDILKDKLSAMAWKNTHKSNSDKSKKSNFSRAIVIPTDEKSKENKYGSAEKYIPKKN